MISDARLYELSLQDVARLRVSALTSALRWAQDVRTLIELNDPDIDVKHWARVAFHFAALAVDEPTRATSRAPAPTLSGSIRVSNPPWGRARR